MKAAPEKSSAAAARTAAPRSSAPARETTFPSPDVSASPDVSPAAAPGPRLNARSLQRLQGRAGNAAVSRLVAQRYAEVVKPPPSQAPGFRKVQQDVAAKKQRIKQHKSAASESKSAQDAAVAPPDDKQAQGKAANAEKMNEAKPGEFDKNAFVGAVNEAIAAQAPKNLDEADGFADSGKADTIKDSVDGKVKDGKESSAEDIESATTAAPDTSQAKEKQVTPMGPDQPPGNPGAPSAADAVPDRQPDKVLDFSEGNQQVDQQMADAEVTEEQLAKGNEPQFDAALSEKKKGEQHTAGAPAKGRAAEAKQLSAAKAGAAASGAAAMSAMTADRAAAGKAVDGGKGETKSADEKKREQVTAKLQKVFDATQKDVEKILGDLDGKVDKQFTEGEKQARDDFTADHKRRMKQYKDRRYSGFTGKGRWLRDKFKGLPQEGLDIFKKSRELYVTTMQSVISSIADTIGTELGRAKTRIATGRNELKAEVDKLPADLRQFGEEAAADFAGKFDDLESQVNDKSTQLVQDLAQKYTEALNSVDEEIKKLEEENKGLIAKVVDAVVGVIQTINELKNLLLGILAKAAGAVMKILKDPIGFLRNLVSAVGAGLNLFIGNIATHLQNGLVSWLLGTAVSTGLEIPSRFDLKGIIQLIASLLGLTWDNIRARVTRKGVPDEAMTKAEQSVPVAQALAREGPAGAAQEITAETGDLKSTILDDLKSYLIPTVLMAGITWILSLLNPASAFIRAVKGIIDIVTFIVTQGAQIVEFVNSVLDAVVAIANGAAAAVPKTVETALAASIPLLIGLLASLLGIGGLANRVRQAFEKVSRPVNRAIDKIVDKIAKAAKRFRTDSKSKKKPDEARGRNGRKGDQSDGKTFRSRVPFSMAGESHTLIADSGNKRAPLLVASNPFSPVVRIPKVISEIRKLKEVSQEAWHDDLIGDLMELLNEARDAQQAIRETNERRQEDKAVGKISSVIAKLARIGVKYGLRSLDDYASLKRFSDYVENGMIKAVYRGKSFRPTFYGGFNSAAKKYGTRAFNRLVKEKADDPARWRNDPLFHDPRGYRCPKCDELKRNVKGKGIFTLDHRVEVAQHWNDIGRKRDQNTRVDFYSETSNLDPMCQSCNSSKNGPSLILNVPETFRGPNEGDSPS
ncbi:phage tail protein [Streptomyces scopuliridis]|uniref:phage tail protein n=1 Tax=Streptomyces scopuliridis TaxID=452529 RepID=UPI0035E08FC8